MVNFQLQDFLFDFKALIGMFGRLWQNKGLLFNDYIMVLFRLFSNHRPSGLSISPCVILFVCLSVCSLLRYRLKVFAPTSWSLMSKVFRDSESLGKSNGKNVVTNFKTFTNKGCKIATHFFFLGGWGRILPYRASILVLVFLTPFYGLFAPTSFSPMWNFLRFLKSFGKSKGKKWPWIWKLLLIKGVKSPRQKKFFTDFLKFVLLCLNVFLPPFPGVKCPNFLVCQNPWGKVMERSGLGFEKFCPWMV